MDYWPCRTGLVTPDLAHFTFSSPSYLYIPVIYPTTKGALPFKLCQRYVESIVLLNDDEIKSAVPILYKSGLVVEPSGCAAFAAIVGKKIPDLEGKNVVCILSGGNIGKDELANFPD